MKSRNSARRLRICYRAGKPLRRTKSRSDFRAVSAWPVRAPGTFYLKRTRRREFNFECRGYGKMHLAPAVASAVATDEYRDYFRAF